MKPVYLAITDDEGLIVSLLHDFMTARPGIEVLFSATGGEELLDKLQHSDPLPDLLLLDLKMKGMDGIQLTQMLKTSFPSVKIVVLSSYYREASLGFMLKTGAAAFLPKEVAPETLADIVTTVSDKGFYFSPEQMDHIARQVSSRVPAPVYESEHNLSERELEVLRLLCRQKTAREIGEQLFITQRTVEGHKNNLFAKTGVKNIAGLVIYAIQRGIVKAEDLPAI